MEKDVQYLIKKRGFNLRTFAAHIDIPYMTLYNIMNRGKSIKNTSFVNFRAIAHGLGMTADELGEWIDGESSNCEGGARES